jgi:raffinose synthase
VTPIDGLMAVYQHKDWWTRPFFERDITKLPDKTQSLLWQSADRYYYLLPVTGGHVRTDVSGGHEGLELKLSAYREGFDRCDALVFVLGTDTDPYKLSKNTVSAALSSLDVPAFHREDKQYPEILDYLGWCSWDAFYHEVNAGGLLEKLEELNNLGLPVKWVMIDDGWSDITNHRLNSFEADAEKFPKGLADVTSRLKKQFGVRWVGVWHTIMGYWGGIEPESRIAKDYKEHLYQTYNNKLIPYPDAAKGFGFWHAWHSYLKKQGIDFVKVDSQSAVINFLKYYQSVGESARAAHTALEASVGLHFNQCVINCMGMGAENIWHRPITSVSRNSDDFVPQEVRSFQEHALQNAYNSYYHGQFYWGDWDMFWTINPDDLQNGVLRAVSGGPVYFSDPVGRTNPDQVWPLIFRDGKILRCDQPGMPTADCITKNPTEEKVPLKVWNIAKGVGVVAAFHIHRESATIAGVVRPSDVPELRGERFVVYDYFRKTAVVLTKGEAYTFELEDNGVALFLIVPAGFRCNPIGLLNKYVASAAIEKEWFSENRQFIRLKEGGMFGFVSVTQPSRARVNGRHAEINMLDEAAGVYSIDCSSIEDEVIIEIVY